MNLQVYISHLKMNFQVEFLFFDIFYVINFIALEIVHKHP